MPLGLGIQLGLAQRNDVGVAAGPTITAAGSIDVSTFKIGTTQTITAGTATATGGGTVSYEFQHLSNGEVKSTLAAYAHVAADDTESGVAQWRAVETGGTNPGATSWQTVASGTITYNAPANTVAPVVSGSTGLGDVLSSTQGTWTGSNVSYSYQWQRNTVDISGATASSYMIVQADDNASIRCVVTATNSGGAISANSNAVSVDDFTVPSITGVPTISGTEQVGQVLTATAASVTGNPTPSRTWQWERSGAPISGATSSTYTLVAADEGETLTVVQTETNAMGVDSAESAATGTIAAASSAVNPSVSADNYTAPTGGNAANFDVTGSYAGADTLDLYAVLGTSAITVTEAQLIAGSGGTNTIEFFNIQGFSFASGDFDITGLTAASEAANELRYVIVERNNGGTTGVLTATDTITNLDFTVPTFSSAEVGNIDADTVRVTLDSAMYGSTVAGDWTLTGNTISSVSFTPGNSYVDLTLGTTATGSDDYTGDLSFTGTSLTDVADNDLATFSGEDVANNVSGGGNSISSITGTPRQTTSGGNTVYIFENTGAISFVADGNFTINYEFIGGGAQGGGTNGSGGGGGGGGRIKTGTFSAVSGQTYNGTVGVGGSTSGANADGQNGGASGITSGTNFPGTANGGGGGGSESSAGLAGGHGGGAGGGAGSGGGATNDGGNAGGSNTGNGEGAGGGGENAAGSNNAGGPSYEGGDGGAGVATTVPGESGTFGNGGGGGGGPTGGAGPNGAGAGVAWGGGNGNAATGVGNGGGGAHGASGVGGAGSRGQVAIWFTP